LPFVLPKASTELHTWNTAHRRDLPFQTFYPITWYYVEPWPLYLKAGKEMPDEENSLWQTTQKLCRQTGVAPHSWTSPHATLKTERAL